MKKTTKLQTASERKDVKPSQAVSEKEEIRPRQHGPQKEKTQITIRVDTNLINAVYAQMKTDNTRITDIIERGLILALAERKHDMSEYSKQVRFVVANTTREQQVQIKGVLVSMAEPHVVEGQRRLLGVEVSKMHELVHWYLGSCSKLEHADVCLEHYSRYGKSAEEIAKLGNL